MKNKDLNVKKIVGKTVRAIRKLRGMTIEELAEKAEINEKFLGEIERGVKGCDYTILIQLAIALKVPVGQLLIEAQRFLERSKEKEA